MILVTRARRGVLAFTMEPMSSALTPAGSTAAWRTIRAYILGRDRWLCQIGTEGVCTGVATCADHIVPREVGGTDLETNLRAACEPCNLARNRERLKLEHEPRPRRVSRW